MGHLYKAKPTKTSRNQPTDKSTENQTLKNAAKSEDADKQLVRHVAESYEQTSSLAIVDAPPEAPSPPPAPVNVFDFLVNGHGDDEWESDEDDMHPEFAPHLSANGYEYGSHPVPAGFDRYQSIPDLKEAAGSDGDFITPAPRRSHTRNLSTDSTNQKKSAKRKRGHPEDLDMSKIHTKDVVMTDVPSMHSGLTGGINRLMTQRHGLPPSPEDSPDSPKSPIKRSRREGKEKKERRKSSDSEKVDRKRTKHEKDSKTPKPSKTSSKQPAPTSATKIRRSFFSSSGAITRRAASPSHAQSPIRKKTKAIEYPSQNGTENGQDDSMALVRISHAPTTKPVASFLDCLAKGTDSEEGVSVWKALKRWRRDAGGSESRDGEKELWKGIKIRMNDRGELIICV